MSIPPNVVSTISEGHVDEGFLKALTELQRKLGAIEKKSTAADDVKAIEDLKPLLESLRSKVCIVIESRIYTLTFPGPREGKGLHRCPDQSYPIAQHERANHSAAKDGQI